MSSTNTNVVNPKDKKLYPFYRHQARGIMEISVFGSGDNKKEARLLYDALKQAGLDEKYFSIRIEVK